MMSTFEKLSALIVERLGVEAADVTMEASFKEDLGADSLDIVEFIMELEEAFDIEIPDEEAEKLATVGDVIKFLEENK
ncbi:acyl carrier protein [Priestia aryabhattai]